MKEIAYFMLPLGAVSAALLCVPWQGLQRSCIGICNMRVSLGRYFSLRLATAFLLYNLFRFVYVCIKLMGGTSTFYARLLSVFPFLSSFRFFAQLQQSPAAVAAGSAASAAALLAGGGRDQQAVTAPTAGYFPVQADQQNQLQALYDIRLQARTLRYQRDFWITLFAAFLWLFVCWAAFLIRSYWRALENAHKSYESVLQERRRVESVAAAKAATKAARIAAAASSSNQRQLPQAHDKKEAAPAAAAAAREVPPAEDVEGIEVAGKKGSKVEVEMARMAAEEMKEEEEEETSAAAAEEVEDEVPVAAVTTRRRKAPADRSGAAICRDEMRGQAMVD